MTGNSQISLPTIGLNIMNLYSILCILQFEYI